MSRKDSDFGWGGLVLVAFDREDNLEGDESAMVNGFCSSAISRH